MHCCQIQRNFRWSDLYYMPFYHSLVA